MSTSVSSDKFKVSEKRVLSDVRLPTSWGAACAVKLKARALAPGRWRLCARARRGPGRAVPHAACDSQPGRGRELGLGASLAKTTNVAGLLYV